MARAPLRWLLCVPMLVLLALPLRPAAADEPAAVPLRRAVLFTSGVGFFERRAEVEGDVQLDLSFDADQINDVLQSLVVQDTGGGQVAAVSYPSQEPLERTLASFRVDLTAAPTLAELLHQLRGADVEVRTPKPVRGTILGVERRPDRLAEGEAIEVEVLNLVTDDGLESIPLSTVQRIKLADPALDAELRRALALLAEAQAAAKRTVSLAFTGQQPRTIRVGYIQPAPLWKTSYRLVLDGEQPLLQGWAIVENATQEDWSDVQVVLVSGRPISFLMDLYQSLYVERPIVQPELYGGTVSQLHGRDLAELDRLARSPRRPSGGMGGGGGGGGGFFGGAPPAEGDEAGDEDVPLVTSVLPLDPSQGVEAAADAGEVGELFRYMIESPVALARGKSAMLPIVNARVEGEKIAIYNPAVHARHPLDGYRLKNTTDLHLMQGPITVFDGGEYAGTARTLDIAPAEERLISYALDLDTEVARQAEDEPQMLVAVKIAGGVLHATHKLVRGQRYTVRNTGARAKTVLIESPLSADWRLVEPTAPTETTRDLERFAIEAPPGETAELSVRHESITQQTVELLAAADDALALLLESEELSAAVQVALEVLSTRRREIAALEGQAQAAEQSLTALHGEQARVRANMEVLDRNSDLYRLYLGNLTKQEEEIARLRAEAGALVRDLATKRSELTDYLAGLEVE